MVTSNQKSISSLGSAGDRAVSAALASAKKVDAYAERDAKRRAIWQAVVACEAFNDQEERKISKLLYKFGPDPFQWSVRRIAAYLDCSERTAERLLKKLRSHGFMETQADNESVGVGQWRGYAAARRLKLPDDHAAILSDRKRRCALRKARAADRRRVMTAAYLVKLADRAALEAVNPVEISSTATNGGSYKRTSISKYEAQENDGGARQWGAHLAASLSRSRERPS